ncbi:MAG: hypothetical protein JRJ27_02385 [Deltaproteobacteria bacterium]|nr:hypothetical protein [Deltaproteobacteria bacterium]
MPRKRDFACAQQAASKGEAIVNYCEPLVRPLQNPTFCSISASSSNFNPRNTLCIPVVKIITFLELEQKSAFFKGLLVTQHMEVSGSCKIQISTSPLHA